MRTLYAMSLGVNHKNHYSAMDQIDKLAFNLHNNKGIYCLLLGSGISKAAGIPTGWNVTKDLIEKVGVLKNSEAPNSPFEWYENEFGSPPTYSNLIDHLASTPEERRNLLKSYFEPTEDEKEKGLKVPTKAHKAIANLIKEGYFKLVITTNFDRLLENALQQVGIDPTVISTPDGISGTMPLIHSDITILKVHGDYLDTRIKNTEEELSNYNPKIDNYLDRIFDEFGLIVCGWLGDWDIALRDAILRSPNRRFSSFWTYLGDTSQTFDDLVQKRAGTKINIDGADSFFKSVHEKVKAIEKYKVESPNSIETLVARTKKYLTDEKYEISFHDLIKTEIDNFLESYYKEFTQEKMNRDVNEKELTERLKRLLNISRRLIAISIQSAYWGQQYHLEHLFKIFKRLTHLELNHNRAYKAWVNLKYYPALLNYYAFGISALARNKYSFIDELQQFELTEIRNSRKEKAVKKLTPYNCFQDNVLKRISKHEKNYTPKSEHLFQTLRDEFKSILPIDEEYTMFFDKFEYLTALNYYHLITKKEDQGWAWVPVGSFAYKQRYSRHRFSLINDFRQELDEKGEEMEILKSGMFNSNKKDLAKAIDSVNEFVGKISLR